jgi:hypothetical protein
MGIDETIEHRRGRASARGRAASGTYVQLTAGGAPSLPGG